MPEKLDEFTKKELDVFLNSNVRMELDTHFVSEVTANMEENSWEILNVNQMNSFVFPKDYKTNTNSFGEKKDENDGGRRWSLKNIDIAIVFETIGNANIEKINDTVYNTVPTFLKDKDYISTDETSGIANRPCGFLTSRGTVMPMIIIPTNLFTNNGLVCPSMFEENGYNPNYQVSMSDNGNCFNWHVMFDSEQEQEQEQEKKQENKTKLDKIRFYGKKVPTQEGFSFINTSGSLTIEEKGKIKERCYNMNDKGDGRYFKLPEEKQNENGHFLTNKNGVPVDTVDESFIFGSTTGDIYGGAFAFSYLFNGTKTSEDKKNQPKIKLNISNIEVSIPQSGNIEVNIEQNKTTGSLSEVKACQKMGQKLEKPFEKAETIIFYPIWNGLALSSGIEDTSMKKDSTGTINVTSDKGFVANKIKDVSMSDFCDPTIKSYNTKKPTPIEILEKTKDGKQSVIINWEPILQLWTINSFPSFAYTPVFFQKNLKFSIYIKDNSGKNILTDKGLDTSSQTRTHYLYPIYYENNTDYTVDGKVRGEKIVMDNDSPDDKEEKNIYYKFDFNFSAKLFQRRGIEIFGFYHQVQQKGKKRDVSNNNGRIKLNSSEYGFISKFNKNYSTYENVLNINESSEQTESYNTDWIKYATEISVNRSNTQSGGTINLDKYAMIGQFERPPQPIGEIRLKAVGGNEKVYATIKDNVYFTGIGLGLSYTDSSQSDSMTLNLSGIEKKLQDIKLAGSPYFDGDPIKTVMDYLSEYANFPYEFNSDFNCYEFTKEKDSDTNEIISLKWSKKTEKVNLTPTWMAGKDAPCPRSVEFQRPAINFLLGTTVYEAISQVCQKTNKTWFITKDGIVRIVDQNVYGIPMNIAYSLSNKKPSLRLNSNQILNISLNPYFENVHNQIVTASLKGKRMGGDYTDVSKMSNLLNTDNMIPNVRYTNLNYFESLEEGDEEKSKHMTNVNFPWSRMIVNNELAILSEEEMDKVHAVNCNQFAFATFTGGITIPGNSLLEIFDTISIDDSEEIFFITNINHSYNSSSRVWTTTLQVTHIDSSFVNKAKDHFNLLTLFPSDPSKE